MPLPPNQTLAEFNAERALHYRAVLLEIVGLATRMARAITEEAEAPPEPGTPKPDRTPQLERVARTIRRCALLDRKLAEPLPTPRPNPATPNRTAARKRILREVEDQIERHADPAHAETLRADLLDRLDRPDLDDEIQTRPLPDIIKDICRDLGALHKYESTFKRRTADDVDALAARAAQPPAPRTAAPIPIPQNQSPKDQSPQDRFPVPKDDAKTIVLRYAAPVRDA